MDKIARIYKITNIVNNKIYIGFTIQRYLSTRFNRHKYNARLKTCRYNSKLYNAMRKYGENNFIIEEIYSSADIEYTLTIMEPYFIKEYDSYNNGYNCTVGGEGRLNSTVSEETREKLRLKGMGRKLSEAAKANISRLNRGLKRTTEYCNRMSIKRARNWKVIYPDGEEVLVSRLKIFCAHEQIPYAHFLKTQGTNTPYHGFKIYAIATE